MEVKIGCIVEGHGEVEAVPILIRRLAQRLDPTLVVRIPPPLRCPRTKLIKAGELERAVELIARKVAPDGAIFVLLDSDDDCPAQIGPYLVSQAAVARSDLPVAVVLAKREYEAWFLAAAPSLGLASNLSDPPDPEMVRDAKGTLRHRLPGSYGETLDQPKLTARFDIDQALRSDSFDKCVREITGLLRKLAKNAIHPH